MTLNSSQPTSAGPIRALLFDLGNVIIEIDFGRFFAALAERDRGTADALRERFFFDDAYERHERGELSFADYAASLRTSLGLKLSDAELLASWNALFVRELPGIDALLAGAKTRWPLYAFTNTNAAHQAVWSQTYAQVLTHFERVFVSSEMGQRKPEPEAFRWVAREIGVAPEQILFFDDTLANIEGAAAVGMPAVHVSSVADIEAALANLD